MKTKWTILALALCSPLWVLAQQPFEFVCTDYIATPDRDQGKFVYDESNNTFTIKDNGVNNIAFQMDKRKDNYYRITNEQTYFAVKGTNLSTTLSQSDIWWFNGFNEGSSVEPTLAVALDSKEQLIVWDIKRAKGLNANFDFGNEVMLISSQGREFIHCLGLTSTAGQSTISDVNYYSTYELVATYPELMTKMGYSADGLSLTAELKAKVENEIRRAEEMIASAVNASGCEELQAAVSEAKEAMATLSADDYRTALSILKKLRETMKAFKQGVATMTYEPLVNGLHATYDEVHLHVLFYGPEVVRVHKSYSPDITKRSLSVIQTHMNEIALEVEETADYVKLTTEKMWVSLHLKTGYLTAGRANGDTLLCEEGSVMTPYKDGPNESYRIAQYLHLSADEYIFGMGQVQNGALNQREQAINLVQDNMKVCIPYFQSSKGYGFFWDNYSPTTFMDGKEQTSFQSTGNEIDYYLLVGDEDGKNVIPLMRELTGRAPMPALWNLGLYQSKERYTSASETMGVVQTYRRLGVPLDCIVQDWQYWGDDNHWNAMEFLNPTFANYRQMIETIHDNHAKLMISVWANFGPQTKQYRDFTAKGRMIEANSYPFGKSVKPYDCYDATTRDEYWAYLYEGLMSKDIDALWLDSSEPDYQQTSANDYDYVTGTGQTWRELRNAFPLAHVGGVHDHFRQAALDGKEGLADKRVAILTRSAFAGQQRYGANTWSGDVTASWENFAKQIPAACNFAACGIPYWNSDIGGFFPGSYSGVGDVAWRRLYMRWMQFGTFTPMMRFHGTGTPREIYQFGSEHDGKGDFDHILKYIKIRYRMLPYLYSTAWQISKHHASFMTALPMAFNHDRGCYDVADEYMFGEAFLVAPIIEDLATSREVYLPAGASWVDFWTGTTHEGGQAITKQAGIDMIPLYVKAGSIVPWGPDVQYANEKTWNDLEIRVYPGADGSFVLYEDETDNYHYEEGRYTEIPFAWDDEQQTLTIGTRTGGFEGMLAERTFRICKVSTRRGISDKHEANYSAVVKYNGEELTVKLDGEDAPVEYKECTAEYIINPSFEDDKRTLTKVAPSGWRVESPTTWWGVNLGQGNGDPQATEGRYIFGVWDSGNHITAQISQTISNLPKGLYELTVDMHASSQGDLIRLGNQRLFANGQVARFRDQLYITGDGDNYPMQTLTLRFEQTEDNAAVKIGVATDGAPAHTWFKIDNFRLYRITDDEHITDIEGPTIQHKADVAAREYYDLSGRSLHQQQEGITIIKETMTDGSVKVSKSSSSQHGF